MKPRPDSPLLSLPEDRQHELADFARDHTLAETVAWLAQARVQTSSAALSRFLSGCRLRQQLDRNASATREFIAHLAQQDPTLTDQRLFDIGNLFFASTALEKQDSRAWCLTQQIAIRKAQHELNAKKYSDQLQARKEAIQRELQAAKSSGGISPETLQKIEHELGLF